MKTSDTAVYSSAGAAGIYCGDHNRHVSPGTPGLVIYKSQIKKKTLEDTPYCCHDDIIIRSSSLRVL